MSEQQEHRWGEPDETRVTACTRPGCTIRVLTDGLGYKHWQPKKRGHWRHQDRFTVPPCTGKDNAP